MSPYYLNIAICLFIVTGILVILWAKRNSSAVSQAFVKAALVLWLLRSAGFAAVYWRLIVLNTRPLHWVSPQTDPLLLVLADAFTILSVWTWLTLLRGPAFSRVGPWGTLVEMIAAWAVIVPVDLILTFQNHTWFVLLPSAVLNFLSWAGAISAVAFRYRERSGPFIITFTAYNSLQIPAYESALLGDPGPEGWIYYALAMGKLFNFVVIVHLLLGSVKEERQQPLLPLLGRLWRIGVVVAVVAALTHLVLHAYPALDKNPWFLALIIIVNALAIWLAIRETAKASKPPADEDNTRGRGASA